LEQIPGRITQEKKNIFFFFFSGAGVCTGGPVLARQAPYHMSYTHPQPFWLELFLLDRVWCFLPLDLNPSASASKVTEIIGICHAWWDYSILWGLKFLKSKPRGIKFKVPKLLPWLRNQIRNPIF
jgi:hypothetical protein